MPVIIGVDPYEASHNAAALDEDGQLLDQQRIPPPWTATRPFVAGLRNGRNGAGRAARTQTINRLHRLLVDLVPGRRPTQPHRQPRRGAAGLGSRPLERRR